MNFIRMQPPSELQEPLESLKGRIMGQLNGRYAGPFALAFTSCTEGEGVTSVAANFAASLAADVKRRIVVMDGSLHRLNSQYPLLENPASRELGVKDENETGKQLPARPIWQTINASGNIDLMYSRVSFANPGRVFGAARFGELINQLKEHYDFIVVDCPPLMGTSGAAMLASQCDASVLVVEAGRVRRESIQRCIQNLEATGANLLGVVLNKRKYPIPEFIYNRL